MRLCTGLTLTVITAAALVGGLTRHATAVSAMTAVPADPHRPTCTTTDPDPDSFPLRTRIHGGPTSYDADGGFRTWFLDLTNTTSRTCGNVYPVIVLVDEKRALRAAQPRLEFYEGTRPRPVVFERTDADELIGVLDHEGFPGFTVRPGRTLTVRLRLAVASGAVSNDVVANAAVVQRRGEDGEWVGESKDYRFRIVDSAGGGGEDEGGGRRGDEGDIRKEGDGTSRNQSDGTGTGTGTGRKQDDRAGTDVRKEHLTLAEELARTGGSVTLYAIGALLLTAGALLVALARRKSR